MGAEGFAEKTHRQAKWMTRTNPESSMRIEGLNWAHHREVTGLPPEQRQEVLGIAARGGLSTRETKLLARRVENRVGAKYGTRTTGELTRLTERGDKFGPVCADPPRIYDNLGTRAAARAHYGGPAGFFSSAEPLAKRRHASPAVPPGFSAISHSSQVVQALGHQAATLKRKTQYNFIYEVSA